jgi:2-keto-3-deoxy-L-fuconate dehydrogenase
LRAHPGYGTEQIEENKKMADRLKGKRAVITAAAAGIGRACAIAFAREGATVIATDINEAGIAGLTKEGIAEVAKLDVRNTADVNAFAKRVGKIDILLNAAGFVHHGTILECSEEDFDFSFDLNVKSMHRTIKAFLPEMLAGGGGSIVNISSCAALRPPANRYVYSSSKAAVSLLTRAVALDFITKGIRCNSICPGTVETPSMLDRAAADEIASMAVYLGSDESAFTTGVDLVVDGGYML